MKSENGDTTESAYDAETTGDGNTGNPAGRGPTPAPPRGSAERAAYHRAAVGIMAAAGEPHGNGQGTPPARANPSRGITPGLGTPAHMPYQGAPATTESGQGAPATPANGGADGSAALQRVGTWGWEAS
eukprot:1744684-Pyramimonas_sp.AAC.1